MNLWARSIKYLNIYCFIAYFAALFTPIISALQGGSYGRIQSLECQRDRSTSKFLEVFKSIFPDLSIGAQSAMHGAQSAMHGAVDKTHTPRILIFDSIFICVMGKLLASRVIVGTFA